MAVIVSNLALIIFEKIDIKMRNVERKYYKNDKNIKQFSVLS